MSRRAKFAALVALVGVVASGLTLMTSTDVTANKVVGGDEWVNPKTYKGKTGKITVTGQKESQIYLMIKGTRKFMSLNTTNGTMTAPVGKYDLVAVAVTTGSGKSKWYANFRPNKPMTITVKEGSTYKLNCGGPLTASVSVKQSGSKAYLDLKMTDRGGWSASVQSMNNPSAVPKFQVLSSSGKVLWQGAFQYG